MKVIEVKVIVCTFLYFYTSAGKLLGLSKPNFMLSFYGPDSCNAGTWQKPFKKLLLGTSRLITYDFGMQH